VRVNDRGPYVDNRLIDLSWRSAHELGYSRRGLARARVRFAGRAPLGGSDAAERRHLAAQPWYRGNLNVAQMPSSEISTGSIGRNETRPVTLGGPARALVDAGLFSTLAEAERMRHELEDRGPVVIEQVGTGTEALFRVRVRSRGDMSDASSAARAGFVPP
jgi:rare lipoprotein A